MATYRSIRGEAVSLGNQGPIPALHYRAPIPAKIIHASFFFGSAAVGTLQLVVTRAGYPLIVKVFSGSWEGPVGMNLQLGDTLDVLVLVPGAGNIDAVISIDERGYVGYD